MSASDSEKREMYFENGAEDSDYNDFAEETNYELVNSQQESSNTAQEVNEKDY